MIVLVDAAGVRQIVASLDGVDLTVWHDSGEAVPQDLESRAYATINGVLAADRRFTKAEFMDLWTPAETVAMMRSPDALLAYFWLRVLASDGDVTMLDSRTVAGIAQAVTAGILTTARAARIRAGLPPE
jgi:hypothetical protein